MRIPLAKPDLRGNEQKYVADAVASTWISSRGPYLERFESEWAKMCGVSCPAVTTTSGTTALHLALLALSVRPGDEVIVPSLTFVAVANAVRYVGAKPVFVDIDQTWCLDPRSVAEVVTPQTRGIIAVHSYGHVADMDALNRIAMLHGLWVIEDTAEAHGATVQRGTLGVTSFYGNKIITTGEGGAVTTGDRGLADRLRILRGHGMDPERRYWFPLIGHNFKMTNVAAAIGCAQLERVKAFRTERLRVFARYRANLKDGRGLLFEQSSAKSPWLFCLGTRGSPQRIVDALTDEGIETRPFFIPIHKLPPYKCSLYLPMTEYAANHFINLPTYPELQDSEIDEISEIILGTTLTQADDRD
jgi:perosamine synthetase